MPTSLLSTCLALVLFLSSTVAQNVAPLTNGDIVTMVNAKLPPALIVFNR